MSDELTINLSVSGSKSGLTFGPMGGTFTRDVSERDKDEGTLTLNTSAVDAQGTNIPIKASLSTVGVLTVNNLDPTNACTIGCRVSSNYVSSFKVLAGEEWPLPITWAVDNIYGQGIGAAVPIVFEAVPA